MVWELSSNGDHGKLDRHLCQSLGTTQNSRREGEGRKKKVLKSREREGKTNKHKQINNKQTKLTCMISIQWGVWGFCSLLGALCHPTPHGFIKLIQPSLIVTFTYYLFIIIIIIIDILTSIILNTIP